jgi:Protein of unknown function (DUF4231)
MPRRQPPGISAARVTAKARRGRRMQATTLEARFPLQRRVWMDCLLRWSGGSDAFLDTSMPDDRSTSDLRLALDLHLRGKPEDAPIRSILALPDIKARLANFDWADRTAIKEQRSYRRFRLLGLRATMTGTVVGALVLLPLDDLIQGWPRWVIQGAQTLALAAAFAATVFIGVRQSGIQWMQSRAVAEKMRADVFRAIIRAGVDTRELLAPALACFLDAQLDWQLGYYKKRGGEHRHSASNTAPYKIMGYLLVAVAVSLGLMGFLSLATSLGLSWWPLTLVTQWVQLEQSGRWQLGIGVMASGILAFASAQSFMDQDDRYASYYEQTAAELDRLRSTDLLKATAAAHDGRVVEVQSFCENAQRILDAEHFAWIFARPRDGVIVAPPE